MATYRRYRANYPFDARDTSELSMSVGDTLLVSPTPQGEWPNHEKWMKGQNENTGSAGDFPGGAYVELMEEFTEPEPDWAPPPLPMRGGPGTHVLPNSVPSHVTEDAPPTPPRRGNSASKISENHDIEPRTPQPQPPVPAPRKRSAPTQHYPTGGEKKNVESALRLPSPVLEKSHNWLDVSFQIPIRCSACELLS